MARISELAITKGGCFFSLVKGGGKSKYVQLGAKKKGSCVHWLLLAQPMLSM